MAEGQATSPMTTGNGRGRLLRPDQLQELLGVSRSRTYEMIAEGHFEALRVGKLLRITEASFHAYLDRQIRLFALEDDESVQGVR
jgi:excisionase family DNA binding protein